MDLHETIYIIHQPEFNNLAMEATWQQYKATCFRAEGEFLCDQDSGGMHEVLNVTEQPIFDFKFVPFDETDDRHFRIVGWKSKADFLKELGYTASDLNDMAFPIALYEAGNFADLILAEEAETVFKNSRSVFDRPVMFIAGTPNRIFPCDSVQNYFEELGEPLFKDKLKKALEAAGLEYVEE